MGGKELKVSISIKANHARRFPFVRASDKFSADQWHEKSESNNTSIRARNGRTILPLVSWTQRPTQSRTRRPTPTIRTWIRCLFGRAKPSEPVRSANRVLHVHERIDPRSIIEAVRKKNGSDYEQLSLFKSKGENPPLREAIEFYKHAHNWSNRLIAGDSLLVMNSLLEKEGMAGQVQMVYFDPPYGIKYGSNFQPFVNKREVKDGKDEDLTAEPEMVKAFRDTWELGIHSYLSFVRDRLLIARELLHESGSVFMQISDENLHHVREIMDEVFGAKNFVGLVTFTKTSSASSELLAGVSDYLLFYAKDKERLKYRRLYKDKAFGGEGASAINRVQLPDGTRRALTVPERQDISLLPKGSKIYRLDNLTSQRPPGDFPIELHGKTYRPKRGYWKTGEPGMAALKAKNRLDATEGGIYYVRYFR